LEWAELAISGQSNDFALPLVMVHGSLFLQFAFTPDGFDPGQVLLKRTELGNSFSLASGHLNPQAEEMLLVFFFSDLQFFFGLFSDLFNLHGYS
jgi:hypothetical protein